MPGNRDYAGSPGSRRAPSGGVRSTNSRSVAGRDSAEPAVVTSGPMATTGVKATSNRSFDHRNVL